MTEPSGVWSQWYEYQYSEGYVLPPKMNITTHRGWVDGPVGDNNYYENINQQVGPLIASDAAQEQRSNLTNDRFTNVQIDGGSDIQGNFPNTYRRYEHLISRGAQLWTADLQPLDYYSYVYSVYDLGVTDYVPDEYGDPIVQIESGNPQMLGWKDWVLKTSVTGVGTPQWGTWRLGSASPNLDMGVVRGGGGSGAIVETRYGSEHAEGNPPTEKTILVPMSQFGTTSTLLFEGIPSYWDGSASIIFPNSFQTTLLSPPPRPLIRYPRFRYLIMGTPELPMRQRHRNDGLATDAREFKGFGSSLQLSIRRGGRTYY